MKPTPSSGIDRCALLSTMAALPVLSSGDGGFQWRQCNGSFVPRTLKAIDTGHRLPAPSGSQH